MCKRQCLFIFRTDIHVCICAQMYVCECLFSNAPMREENFKIDKSPSVDGFALLCWVLVSPPWFAITSMYMWSECERVWFDAGSLRFAFSFCSVSFWMQAQLRRIFCGIIFTSFRGPEKPKTEHALYVVLSLYPSAMLHVIHYLTVHLCALHMNAWMWV